MSETQSPPQELAGIHASIMRRFVFLQQQDRLAHAYLFVGPDKVGKSETAHEIARLLNCEANREGKRDQPCYTCASCRKVDSANHPDVSLITIEEGQQTIKIGQIRELMGRTHLRPFEGRYKVFILKDIERLTPEGSNALLKTLEEPSDSSVLFLTTSVPEECPDTVRSRCHTVMFVPLARDTLVAQLKDDYAIADEIAHFLAGFTEGCGGRARRLLESNFFEQKNVVIDNFFLREDQDKFMKEVLGDRDRTRELLEVLFVWFRDLLLLKAGIDKERLVNRDRYGELWHWQERFTLTRVQDIIDNIVHTFKLLEANLNVKIPLMILREKIWAK